MAVNDPRFAVSRFDALPGPLETVTLVLEGELSGTVLREPVRLVIRPPEGADAIELPTVGRSQRGDGAWSLRFAGAMPPPGTRFGLALGRWLRIALPEPDVGAPPEADARYTELAREVNRLRHTLDAAQLEHGLKPTASELQALRSQVEQRDRRIADLNAERARLVAAAPGAPGAMDADGEAPLRELSAALEAEQARAQELTGALDIERRRAQELTAVLEAERRRAQELSGTLESDRARSAELAAAHDAARARVDELAGAYDALHNHTQQLAAGHESVRAASHSQLEQLHAQVAQLTAAQREAQERIEGLTEAHRAEHERAERTGAERDQLARELDAARAERSEADGELEMARREVNEAMAALEGERDQLVALRRELNAARRERTEALVALERAKVLPAPQTDEGRRRSGPQAGKPETEPAAEKPPAEHPTTERQQAQPREGPEPEPVQTATGEFVRVLSPQPRHRSTGQLDADGTFVPRDTAAIGARHIKPAELRGRRHHAPGVRRSGPQPPLVVGAIGGALMAIGLLLAFLLILQALF